MGGRRKVSFLAQLGRSAMGMKLATSNDIWRRLFRDQHLPLRQITVKYHDTENGPDLTFNLMAPISLLCGENGVGKSRALRALHQALGSELHPSDFRPIIGPPLLEILEVSAVVQDYADGSPVNEPCTVNNIAKLSDRMRDSSGTCRIHWFDPTVQIPYLLHILRHDKSLPDLWEGVAPKVLSAGELDDVSALVGRTYSKLEIFEILDYGDHDTVPYFRATSYGETYGAEAMGLGELSLLFFYWSLSRTNYGSVLLLEEPETFIAPRSQRVLIDMVAARTEAQHMFVAITSHSGVITERIPQNHVDYMSRQGKEVTFLRNPPRSLLADRLGLVQPRPVLCLVEDEVAAAFAQVLIEAGNSKYMSNCAIYVASGESEVTATLRRIEPNGPTPIVLVGLYDGDQRSKFPKGLKWPVMCLPGQDAPEQFVMKLIERERSRIEEVVGMPRGQVVTALASVDGLNHHDWISGFCRALLLTKEELLRRVATFMLNHDRETLDTFVATLDRVVTEASRSI